MWWCWFVLLLVAVTCIIWLWLFTKFLHCQVTVLHFVINLGVVFLILSKYTAHHQIALVSFRTVIPSICICWHCTATKKFPSFLFVHVFIYSSTDLILLNRSHSIVITINFHAQVLALDSGLQAHFSFPLSVFIILWTRSKIRYSLFILYFPLHNPAASRFSEVSWLLLVENGI